MASGTIYRRTTPADSSSWVPHTTWNEGGRRRQCKGAFWLEGLEHQGRRPSTLHGYRRALERYVLSRLGTMALQDLRVTDIDTLSADLLRNGRQGGGGWSMSPVHHVHTALNKLFNDAERRAS